MKEVGKTWKLGDAYMAVEKDSLDYPKVVLPDHAPLDSTLTNFHFVGIDAYYRDIQAILFTGYNNLILPFVGSGYYTLVSDQGTEGDYFIASCNAHRLQALNKPNPVYRVYLKLRKESGSGA